VVDVLAHIDLPKKYGKRLPSEPFERYDEVVRRRRPSGVAVEVSSQGLRKPAAEVYPSPEFLRGSALPGSEITLASDAHVPHEAADGHAEVVAAARAAGYTTHLRFDRRNPIPTPLPASCTEWLGHIRRLATRVRGRAYVVDFGAMSAAPTVWLTTLGCAKNQVDSEKVEMMLGDAGYVLADDPETADVVMVNTCAFIEEARQESVETILEAQDRRRPAPHRGHRLHGPALRRRSGAGAPEVDAVVGLDRYGNWSTPSTGSPGSARTAGIAGVRSRCVAAR
jgi:hypothetical protein